MSAGDRSGPPGGAPDAPESLLPLRDADVADIPLLFASATERMRETAIAFGQNGPANSPLMNLLNERLPEDHGLGEVGTHYYNAGLIYAYLIVERKYRAGYGGDIPPLDTAAYKRGNLTVMAARRYARGSRYSELWQRVRIKEARFIGSTALSHVYTPIVEQVRKDLAGKGINNEKDEQALHLGMVEGAIFMGAALRDPWSPEVQEFPVDKSVLNTR